MNESFISCYGIKSYDFLGVWGKVESLCYFWVEKMCGEWVKMNSKIGYYRFRWRVIFYDFFPIIYYY